MADKFSLDDILEEYSSKAKNAREKSDFDVEKLLEETVAKKKSHEIASQIAEAYENSEADEASTQTEAKESNNAASLDLSLIHI